MIDSIWRPMPAAASNSANDALAPELQSAWCYVQRMQMRVLDVICVIDVQCGQLRHAGPGPAYHGHRNIRVAKPAAIAAMCWTPGSVSPQAFTL